MATKRKFKSDAFEAIHAAVEGMIEAGTVDKETERAFEEECFETPRQETSKEIKTSRGRKGFSHRGAPIHPLDALAEDTEDLIRTYGL
jgi:putative transcriptional regulator